MRALTAPTMATVLCLAACGSATTSTETTSASTPGRRQVEVAVDGSTTMQRSGKEPYQGAMVINLWTMQTDPGASDRNNFASVYIEPNDPELSFDGVKIVDGSDKGDRVAREQFQVGKSVIVEGKCKERYRIEILAFSAGKPEAKRATAAAKIRVIELNPFDASCKDKTPQP